MRKPGSWRWPLAVALGLLATAGLVRLLTASEPLPDDELAVLESEDDSFEPIDLPERLPGPVDPLSPSPRSIDPSELLPTRLGGGRGPKREFGIRVIDGNGCGVPDATVGVWTRNASHPYAKTLLGAREAYMSRFYPGHPVDADSLSWSWLVWADPTWADPGDVRKTDADGRCVVPLPDGHVAIAAAHLTAGSSGLWTGEAWEALAGPDGSEPFELLIRIAPECRITGRVVDAAGQPLTGALVLVSLPGGKAGSFLPRLPRPVLSDEEGRFDFACSAPAYGQLCALSGGRWSNMHRLMVDSEGAAGFTLRIGAATSISGLVVDARGDPVGGAEVHASGPERTDEQTSSGDDGRYTLELPLAGRWLVGAIKEAWLPQDAVAVEVGATPPEPVTLRLIEGASLRGRVRWKSGEPAAGLLVMAHEDFRDRLEASRVSGLLMSIRTCRTEADGTFELPNLHPAQKLNVSASREWDWKSPMEADAKKVTPGTFVEIEVDEDEPIAWPLDGVVLDDETGEPVPEFFVSVVPFRSSGFVAFGRGVRAFRSLEGRFHVESIRYAEPYVRVVAAGYAERIAGPVQLAAQTDPLEIRLGRAATLDVSVADTEGRPIAGALVLLAPVLGDDRFDAPSAREGTTDEAGHYLWKGLPPETYRAQALSDAGRSPIGAATLRSGGQHVLALKLAPDEHSGSLVVRALDPAGVPAAGVLVKLPAYSMKRADALPRQSKTNADGEVTFAGLPAGNYSVMSEIAGMIAFGQASVEAGASATVELQPDDD